MRSEHISHRNNINRVASVLLERYESPQSVVVGVDVPRDIRGCREYCRPRFVVLLLLLLVVFVVLVVVVVRVEPQKHGHRRDEHVLVDRIIGYVGGRDHRGGVGRVTSLSSLLLIIHKIILLLLRIHCRRCSSRIRRTSTICYERATRKSSRSCRRGNVRGEPGGGGIPPHSCIRQHENTTTIQDRP